MADENNNGGGERRQGIIDLKKEIELAQLQNSKIIAHLIQEFGGEDPLTGNKVEGNVAKSLKSLQNSVDGINIKVGIQNGRVGKLENWKSYMNGGVAILGVAFCAIIAAVVDIMIKGKG